MRQTQSNLVLREDVNGSEALKEAVLAHQDDLVSLGGSYQGDRTAFPNVPAGGSWLATPKGLYEGIFTDDVTPLPKWRRVSNGVLYNPGDNIPTTL